MDLSEHSSNAAPISKAEPVVSHQLLDETAEAEKNRGQLKAILFDSAAQEHPVETLRSGNAKGQIVGGCLSVLCTAIGTPYCPSFDGKILFLEDVGEAPYKIDRMLQHLANTGAFDRVEAVVFGAMHKCADPYNDIRKVILDVLGRYSFPVAFGLPSGHGLTNTSIFLGTCAYLDGDNAILRISPWGDLPEARR